MDGPPVEECPRGCLRVEEQIKTCHTNVSISETSHAESYDSHQCTICHGYISVNSMHDWFWKSEEIAEVIAQISDSRQPYCLSITTLNPPYFKLRCFISE